MRFVAIALLCLVPLTAQAKQSPFPPVTQYDGDRIAARQAQMGADVIKAVRRERASKRHHRRQRAPVVRRIGLAEGMGREAGRALGRPAAWCGWYLGQLLGMPARHLWLARNWAKVGTNAGGPATGVVVVWSHHVGIITGRQFGRWVIKSGNDGHRVRERPRSVARAIAFRRV